MVPVFPGDANTNIAERSQTDSRDGTDDSGTAKVMLAPPRGTLLRAGGADWLDPWRGSDKDQEVVSGRRDDDKEDSWAALYMDARRKPQDLHRT